MKMDEPFGFLMDANAVEATTSAIRRAIWLQTIKDPMFDFEGFPWRKAAQRRKEIPILKCAG